MSAIPKTIEAVPAWRDCVQGFDLPLRRQVAVTVESADRKSTRLNSRHDQNSYAVIFLKKKIIMSR